MSEIGKILVVGNILLMKLINQVIEAFIANAVVNAKFYFQFKRLIRLDNLW